MNKDPFKENVLENNNDTIQVPSKEEVVAMRKIVLEGMSEEEVDRLTENIKVAKLTELFLKGMDFRMMINDRWRLLLVSVHIIWMARRI